MLLLGLWVECDLFLYIYFKLLLVPSLGYFLFTVIGKAFQQLISMKYQFQLACDGCVGLEVSLIM